MHNVGVLAGFHSKSMTISYLRGHHVLQIRTYAFRYITRYTATLVSRGQTAFFLLHSDGKKGSGELRIIFLFHRSPLVDFGDYVSDVKRLPWRMAPFHNVVYTIDTIYVYTVGNIMHINESIHHTCKYAPYVISRRYHT